MTNVTYVDRETMFLDVLADKFTVDSGCWEWTGRKDQKGYGRFDHGKPNRPHRAHRIIYELMIGPIPEGLEIDHLCRNRACVRPDHLEAVDHHTNILRSTRWTK